MPLHLTIGNKNYSSWSFRPWIAMKVAGIPFDEEVISLDAKDFKARVTRISAPSRRACCNSLSFFLVCDRSRNTAIKCPTVQQACTA